MKTDKALSIYFVFDYQSEASKAAKQLNHRGLKAKQVEHLVRGMLAPGVATAMKQQIWNKLISQGMNWSTVTKIFFGMKLAQAFTNRIGGELVILANDKTSDFLKKTFEGCI